MQTFAQGKTLSVDTTLVFMALISRWPCPIFNQAGPWKKKIRLTKSQKGRIVFLPLFKQRDEYNRKDKSPVFNKKIMDNGKQNTTMKQESKMDNTHISVVGLSASVN